MNERNNYGGHYGGQADAPRPQGIVFRWRSSARFSPYMWLNYADYHGRELKLDFGRYDVVIRGRAGDYRVGDPSIGIIFEAIARHECPEIAEKEGELTIEIIEKEDVPAGP